MSDLWPLLCETTLSLWHVFSEVGVGGRGCVGLSDISSAEWLLPIWRRTTDLSSVLYKRKKKKKKTFQIEILDLSARCVVCNRQWCYRCLFRSLVFDDMFTDLPLNHGVKVNRSAVPVCCHQGVLCAHAACEQSEGGFQEYAVFVMMQVLYFDITSR